MERGALLKVMIKKKEGYGIVLTAEFNCQYRAMDKIIGKY